MFKKRTSRGSRYSRQQVLALKVRSPRIVFFQCLKIFRNVIRLSLLVGMAVLLGLGVSFGWQKLFVENEEFQLKYIELRNEGGNDPRFLTHSRVEERAGIHPKQKLFALDLAALQEKIVALPEIELAEVTRRLPGTLRIKVKERTPVAWVACRSLGILERDVSEGMLVDEKGYLFRCDSDQLWEFSQNLPTIMVAEAGEEEVTDGEFLKHEGLQAALQLVLLSEKKMSGNERPAWVIVKDEIMLEMKTLGGVLATLSYFDQERQLMRLTQLHQHALTQGRILSKVNLIPQRYLPVEYQTSQ